MAPLSTIRILLLPYTLPPSSDVLPPSAFFFLQVVIDQNVLIKASAELTMTEASSIADNTLEYTVRSLLWALHAPEILKANNGEGGWGGDGARNGVMGSAA